MNAGLPTVLILPVGLNVDLGKRLMNFVNGAMNRQFRNGRNEIFFVSSVERDAGWPQRLAPVLDATQTPSFGVKSAQEPRKDTKALVSEALLATVDKNPTVVRIGRN